MDKSPIRLRQLCVAAADLFAVAESFRSAFGLAVFHGKADLSRFGVPHEPPSPHSAAFFQKHGLVNALLPVGNDFIEIVAPTRADAPAARYIARRGGDAGYMVILEVDDVAPYEERARANGFRIAGGADYPEYRDLHLDPRDTLGSMLAFARQREGRPMDGGWHPAGPRWRAAAGAGAAIVAAELACRDPRDAARRWSLAIGRPAEEIASGWRIRLDGSEARFVAAPQGAGDVLIGADLAGLPGDPAKPITKGVPIGGVRWNSV